MREASSSLTAPRRGARACDVAAPAPTRTAHRFIRGRARDMALLLANETADPRACAAEHVCAAALKLADAQRGTWLRHYVGQLSPKNVTHFSRFVKMPRFGEGTSKLCLNDTVPHEDFAQARLQRDASAAEPANVLHVVFIDDRATPDVEGMASVARHVARLGGRSERLAYIALLWNAPPTANATARAANIEILHVASSPTRPWGPFTASGARCIYTGLQQMVPKKSKMRIAAIAKPLLHWILPDSVQQALILDTDVVPLRPLDTLLDQLAEMRRRGALIGLVHEQSRFYQMHARMPPSYRGYNGGIQLHDLATMRRTPAWDATLDAFQDVRLFPQIGYSGDQNLYNGIAALFPHFFFNLGCEWNRQLGSWYMGGETMARGLAADETSHYCKAPCALLHFNAMKCGATLMREAGGSCTAWTGWIDRLSSGRGGTPSNETCPDDAMLARMVRNGHARGALEAVEVHDYAEAVRKWFGGCCIPQVKS